MPVNAILGRCSQSAGRLLNTCVLPIIGHSKSVRANVHVHKESRVCACVWYGEAPFAANGFANIMMKSCRLSVSAPPSSIVSLRPYSAVPPCLCRFRKVGGRVWPPGRVLCRANPLVYIATLPLVGWENLEVVLRDKYPDELALHSMVLVETEDSVTMFDFLPELPKSPVVAAALLSGRQVKGVTRERSLSQLPVRRCWLVGPCTQQQVQLALLTSMYVLARRV